MAVQACRVLGAWRCSLRAATCTARHSVCLRIAACVQATHVTGSPPLVAIRRPANPLHPYHRRAITSAGKIPPLPMREREKEKRKRERDKGRGNQATQQCHGQAMLRPHMGLLEFLLLCIGRRERKGVALPLPGGEMTEERPTGGPPLLREPSRLPCLVQARWRVRRLAEPRPWAATPTDVGQAFDGVQPARGVRCGCCPGRRRSGRKRKKKGKKKRKRGGGMKEEAGAAAGTGPIVSGRLAGQRGSSSGPRPSAT